MKKKFIVNKILVLSENFDKDHCYNSNNCKKKYEDALSCINNNSIDEITLRFF